MGKKELHLGRFRLIHSSQKPRPLRIFFQKGMLLELINDYNTAFAKDRKILLHFE